MAGFDWFRRSFEPSDKPAEPSEPAAEGDSPSAKADQAGPAAPALSSEDYLTWAKAAYQNLQKQQAPAETVAAPDTTPAAAPTSETPEAPADPTTVAPLATEGALAPEAAPAVPAPKIDAEAAPEVEPAAADQIAEPPPSLPLWARAEAERQQRLERLEQMAIAEPESVPMATEAPTAPALPPDINLDEAFLWSAEVLAAQGRRPDDISLEEITWLKRLRQGLNKTRLGLINQLKAIVGQGPLNEEAVMEIEALLLQADVGVTATDKVIEALQTRLRQEVLPPDQAIAYLKSILRDMLDAPLGKAHNLTFVPAKDTLNIWLMTGVNGAGKTTTIGKLAHIAQKSGYRTLIAAADTFRAAAVEQVKVWGARSQVEVIANPGKNTDPAAVVFDAIAAAQSRNIDLLLVDTAGRLQNKKNLMDELAKIRRIVDKQAPNATIEALLVLDATLGQNGLRQAEIFAEAANLSGVVLTKLDGTAKGGVALAVVEQLGLPIRFIGAGEGIEDLRPFSSYEFVEALLSG